MSEPSSSAMPHPTRDGQRVVPVHQPEELVAAYLRQGLVSEAPINRLLPVKGMRRGDRPALTQGNRLLTYAQLAHAVQRFAGHLAGSGVGPGDIVTWQAPNWWEAYVTALAVWHVGAISNPVVGFYRENELRHIVSELRPDAVVCAGRAGGHSSAELMADVLTELDIEPKAKVVLRGEQTGWTTGEEALGHTPIVEPAALASDDPCLVLYTSGTTSPPKGAIHTSRSLLAETEQIRQEWGLGWQDVGYMPAPLPHITGMLIGMTVPISVGGHLVLSDGWDAERAAEEVARHRVTFSAGATVFLQELTAATATSRHDASSWRIYACGGASVPRSVMEAAEEQNIPAIRVYGMTELPTATLGDRSVPFERRAGTDGVVALGVEVRTLGEDGEFLPVKTPGELVVRGPERFAGYVDHAGNTAILPGGWFRTGDVGICDEHGDVTITGRLKDIINRGGEKFSTREIEDLLARHPLVQRVAVVPAPDQRLGETPAAFVVITGAPEAADLIDHLVAAGLPKRKLPTQWFTLPELPTTASGKIKKNELTTLLEDGAAEL